MSRWLARDDVVRLTGKHRPSAQCRELDRLKIRFKPGAGGWPLVLPEDVDGTRPKARNSGPRWHLINA